MQTTPTPTKNTWSRSVSSSEVLHSRRHSDDIRNFVKGVMIESYIEPGSQKVGEHIYGKSITDPCLGWEDSERLLYEIAEGL